MSVAPAILLDHRGEVISSPKIRRERARTAIRASFDAAKTTNENSRHWANADYLGPNSELDPGVRRTLRSRARYECANNTYAAGMIRTLANDTIGTGPGLQITEKGVSRDTAAAIEDAFWRWCVAVRLPEKLRLMRQAKARDGETFAQLFTNRRATNPVSLDFRPFEAEMVSATTYGLSMSDALDGIILDDFGNVTAYRVLSEHPGDLTGRNFGGAETVPAREIIHLLNADRPGQYRGSPEITAALPLYAQLRRYTLAVIRAAESAAIPSWIMRTQQPPSEMDFADPMDVLDTERGMGLVLPGGYTVEQLKAEHPTSTYPQFKREIVAEIARVLTMPYNVAAGDSSSYNYSSGRLDHRTYYKTLRVERSYIETVALDVLFPAWWDEARLIPGLLPPQFDRSSPAPLHDWRWDGDEHVDPTKEADAAEMRLRIGLTSYPDEVARLGGDINVIHQKNADALGISVAEYRNDLRENLYPSKPAPAMPAPSAGQKKPVADDAEEDPPGKEAADE